MFRIFVLICCVSSFYLQGNEAAVQRCLQRIRQQPEAQRLMQEIRSKGGPMGFAVHDHPVVRKFGACWDIDRRVILISPDFHDDEGAMIGSILFEMHNAAAAPELACLEDRAARGELCREQYVKAVEYLEYVNSKRCAEIAQKGIDSGHFPPSARMKTYRDFEEHYYYQRISGHSEAVGRIYDQIVVQ